MKDPAFLFYYQDWLVGTYFLNRREKGAYMDLLCYQADKGKLTMQIIKEVLNGDIEVWDKIKDKFIEENGLYYNRRLMEERSKRLLYTESRRNNRTKKGRNICNTYDPHMENENEDENEDINNIKKVSKKFVAPLLEEVMEYFRINGYSQESGARAWSYYTEGNWHDSTGKPVKNWKQKCQAVWFKDENKTKESLFEQINKLHA